MTSVVAIVDRTKDNVGLVWHKSVLPLTHVKPLSIPIVTCYCNCVSNTNYRMACSSARCLGSTPAELRILSDAWSTHEPEKKKTNKDNILTTPRQSVSTALRAQCVCLFPRQCTCAVRAVCCVITRVHMNNACAFACTCSVRVVCVYVCLRAVRVDVQVCEWY